jgi:hypothetical protein
LIYGPIASLCASGRALTDIHPKLRQTGTM